MGKIDFEAYHYECHNKGNYLHFKIKGEECLEASIHFIGKAVLETQNHGIFKILYEEEFRGSALTIDLIQISEYIMKFKFEKNHKLKVAYVNLVNDKMGVDFFEDFLNNRGFNLKIFDNNKEAIQWLTT